MKLILIALLTVLNPVKKAENTGSGIEWLDMESVSKKLEEQQKPVIIDLYTNWCYWCKVMDKKTYANKDIIAYLKENFYTVKLDAESKSDVSWQNKKYSYNVGYKCNELALYLTQGQLAYPTTVIIPEKGAGPIPIAGFMEPKDMEPVLKYFGTGAYKKETFPSFQANFKSDWKSKK